MTQIALALVAAGVKIKPLNERIWLFIRDNPGCNLRKIQDFYGKVGTAQAVNTLYLRKMVTRSKEYRMASNFRGKHVYTYTAAMADYDVLPMPYKSKVVEPETIIEPVQVEMRIPENENLHPDNLVVPEAVQDLDTQIDAMTVGEARKLYGKLHAIFGASRHA